MKKQRDDILDWAKNDALREIGVLTKRGEYIEGAGEFKWHPFRYHYFRTSSQGIPSRIIVRQERGKLYFTV